MAGEVTITLSNAEFDALLLMMGYAAGAAHKEHNEALFNSFLRLANRVNQNNPGWTPYVTCSTPAPD